jgi:iron complex transport system permease protein
MPADVKAVEAVGASRRPVVVLAVLAAAAVAGVVLFLTVGARGDWGFILAFRGTKVATMVVVGVAVGVATVIFQTIVGNRILTPSIMGFDALYGLIQTALVFALGTAVAAGLNHHLRFVVEAATLAGFAAVLYRWLFSGGLRGLHLLMLVGIVFGVLFRSLALFLQKVLDPAAFLLVQDRLFASFNRPDGDLLVISAAIVAAVLVAGWRGARLLDVLALGREAAIGLGVDHRRAVTACLLAVSVLVAVSTALVGPLLFLGLLAANLAALLVATHRHAIVLPAAALVGVCCLTFGQLAVEHLFAFDTALGIVIEFAGGLVFLTLLLRGHAR